jgi:energy-coupling factor transporter ATP-binding protein EcfA2
MQLSEGVHLGIKENYSSLQNLEFYILVGVTGVGKSTTLEALQALDVNFRLLPDRRIITDAAIFGGEIITDREARFARTAAYRETHPGGMAQALEDIYVQLQAPILFDGLRGLNEVQHAAKAFPKARFIALDAPDLTRVKRLLNRQDTFDQIAKQKTNLREIKNIEDIFSSQELQELEAIPTDPSELEAKVRIVVTERQNYNPKTANAYLQALEPQRVLYLDTTTAPPNAIAMKIRDWMTP